ARAGRREGVLHDAAPHRLQRRGGQHAVPPADRDGWPGSRSGIDDHSREKGDAVMSSTQGDTVVGAPAEAGQAGRDAEPGGAGSGERFIYFFGEGRAEGRGDMKDALGGKGAGLAEMTSAGVPVPPGFTITTAVCRFYHANGRALPESFAAQQDAALARLESTLGKRLADADDPLLVSVRSGAKFSMP